MTTRCWTFALGVALAALPGASAEVPERAPCGQTLVVPEAHQDLGELYYVLAGAGTQLTWDSDAELLRLVATCNRVVGYLAAPFELEAGKPPLLAGALRVPVASLRTGYETFDAMLHSPEQLGRDQHPEILLAFTAAGPATDVVASDNREHCSFELSGELTVKGTTVPFTAAARLALLPFADATQLFSPSDLVVLRTGFDVTPAELGIATGGALGAGFGADTVHLELYLMGTTIHPSKNFDPRIDAELYVKQLAFMTRLRDFDDPIAAAPLGRQLLAAAWDDSRMLNELALGLLTDEQLRRRDFDLAERAASRANELSKHQDPTHLATLARLCFERGDLEGALEWARQAVDHLEGQPFFIGPPIRAALAEYEAQAAAVKEEPDQGSPK